MIAPRSGRQLPAAVVALAGALAVVLVAVALVGVRSRLSEPSFVIGAAGPTTSTALPVATIVAEPLPEPVAEPLVEESPVDDAPAEEPLVEGDVLGLKVADGQPYPPAIAFSSRIAVPDHLVFVLVLGSDARPGQDMLRSRADSIHLLALNPASGAGTMVGFPRDSYVSFPDGRRGKINEALARGGPTYAAETVRRLTGLPVDFYVITGFPGLETMVDQLGGLDVYVDRRMDDPFSGARFERGWHHFDGAQALAYSRNRHDVPDGDFGRSLHQGTVMLSALGKLRSEVGDDAGLLRWLAVLGRSARLDVPADQLPGLAALARRMAPERLTNVVLPGRVGYAGSASVVYLSADAASLFADLRDDAVIGAGDTSLAPVAAIPPPPPVTTAPPSTTVPPTTVPPTTVPPTTVPPSTTPEPPSDESPPPAEPPPPSAPPPTASTLPGVRPTTTTTAPGQA